MSDGGRPELDDAGLEAAAGDVLRPFTADRRELALAAFDLRHLDAELAELVTDLGRDVVALRDQDTVSAQRLTFTTTAGDVHLDVDPIGPDEVMVAVSLDGPGADKIQACRLGFANGQAAVAATELRSPMVFDTVALPATVRVELDLDDGTIVTPWTSLP